MNGGRVQKNDGPNAPGRSSRSRLKTEAGMTYEQEGRVLLDLGCLSFFSFLGGGNGGDRSDSEMLQVVSRGSHWKIFSPPLIHLI